MYVCTHLNTYMYLLVKLQPLVGFSRLTVQGKLSGDGTNSNGRNFTIYFASYEDVTRNTRQFQMCAKLYLFNSDVYMCVCKRRKER